MLLLKPEAQQRLIGDPSADQPSFESGFKCELLWRGAGKVALVFEDKSPSMASLTSVSFIKEFSKRLLVAFPGIQPCFSRHDFDPQSPSFPSVIEEHNRQKRAFKPLTEYPGMGNSRRCGFTGLRGNRPAIREGKTNLHYISRTLSAAREIYRNSKTNQVTGQNWHEAETIEELCNLEKADSKLALVYIDANQVSKLFRDRFESNNISKIRGFIETFNSIFRGAYNKTCVSLMSKYEADNYTIAPLKMLYCGGDDLVFLTRGDIAMIAIDTYLNEFTKLKCSSENKTLFKDLSVSCGVAISSPVTPLHKMFSLAKVLCSNAKQDRLAKCHNDSSVDWHYMESSQDTNINQIRASVLRTLTNRPYHYNFNNISGAKQNWQTLYQGADVIKSSKWPRSLIYELKECFAKEEHAMKLFKHRFEARGFKIEDLCLENEHDTDFGNDSLSTVLFDRIEFLKFLSEEGLK